MRYSEEEVNALILNTVGIHHLPKAEFTKIVRQRPYDQVSTKRIIFIDLKYWISFRIALDDEGTSNTAFHKQKMLFKSIYEQMLKLSENGKVAFVISDSILTEVEKMPLDKRLKTARIMDNLHVKIVLNGLNACSFEYINIDRITAGKQPIDDYHLSSVYEANRFLTATMLKEFESEPDIIYNLLYDSMSNMTVAEYLKETDGGFYDLSENFAQMMNQTKKKDTVPHTYKELLIQGLASQTKSLEKLLKYKPISKVEPEKQLSLYRKAAPFLYLHSAIHAAINMEKSRKVHKNDFYDLSHSCIGVGYADYFFTEKKFHHLLISKPIDCSSYYKCDLYSEPIEILTVLTQLNQL